MPHTPVLLQEVLRYLDPRPGNFVIDGTLDGGGHAQKILTRISPNGTFLGVDWDQGMVERFAAAHRMTDPPATARHERAWNSCHAVHGNYADLREILHAGQFPQANGLLLDLGFSSEQLESSHRGFSFLSDEPLVMTYDVRREPVRDILHRLGETELTTILKNLGGERYAGRIAKAIVTKAARQIIRTTKDLAETVRSAVPHGYEHGRIDPATRTFQALRIYANDELGNLTRVLGDIPEIVKSGGRVVIVSFHSLEDRLVKDAFRRGAREGRYELLTKKPVIASRDEVRENPRSRSAKLRAIRISH